MRAQPGSLRKDTDARSRFYPEHRARLMGQRPPRWRLDTNSAEIYLTKQLRQPAFWGDAPPCSAISGVIRNVFHL